MGCGTSCSSGRLAEPEVRFSGAGGPCPVSDLSRFSGLDVVVAVTQRSVNAIMLQYLHGAERAAQEVIRCYVFESPISATVVEISYTALKDKAGGSDPFQLPDGADQTDPDVMSLAKALFVGAFKAKGGLPKIPLSEMPALVAFGIHSDSPVTFTLTSSEFQVVGMEYVGISEAIATNKTQPEGPGAKPWYFQFEVDMARVAMNPGAGVPPAVERRIEDLLASVGPGAFGVQQLLLELETALLTATPVIPGISEKDKQKPLWRTMSTVFTGAYFDELKRQGNPVFNYTFTTTAPPSRSTLALRAIQHSTSPYWAGGQPTASSSSCLAYLCTTQSQPPNIVPFPWNWVSAEDTSQVAGVVSVRRSDFADWLEQEMSSASAGLCYDTSVRLTHHGENYHIHWGVTSAKNPEWFKVVEPPAAASGGGLVTLKMAFAHQASDSSSDSLSSSSIYMDFNTYVDGRITFQSTKIILWVRVQVEMGFHHHESFAHYNDLPIKSYYNKAHTVTYDLAVSQQGELKLSMTSNIDNDSCDWDFHAKGLFGLAGIENELQNGMYHFQARLNTTLDGMFTHYTTRLTSILNGYGQWVFPGADSFVMHNVGFSDTCDLVTQVTYADPGMKASLGIRGGDAGALDALRAAQTQEAPAASYDFRTSAELMTNFVQSDILQPQKAFQALQTQAGLSLLFAISTGGELNVVVEESGKTQHGWAVRSLSSALISKSFPDGGATVRTFAVSQAAGKGSRREIHVAMVVEAAGSSHLYLSMSNSVSDLSWTQDIPWVAAPFNAAGARRAAEAPSPFHIAGVMLSKATDGEMIVADVTRNPAAARPLLQRYWIDLSSPGAPLWVKHALGADFEASTYQSCLGRRANEPAGVDGIYTMGKVGDGSQLIYRPIYNVFDPAAPPLVSRLRLPGGLVPEAIAAAHRFKGDNATDLYVMAKGSLFYFAADAQQDEATGVAVAEHPSLLAGVRKLFAAEEAGEVTVWGLNGSDEVFYLSCHTTGILDQSAWSVPLPIYTGVDAMSPYMDRRHCANTFFAHTGSGLIKATKTPATGLWTRRHLHLPAKELTQDAREFKSFTTEVTVTSKDTGEVAAGVEVELTATTVTSVSINHLYYAVGPQPVRVKTDSQGTVTIVEQTHDLVATRFSAAIAPAVAAPPASRRRPGGSAPVEIRPMAAAFQRNAALNTVDKLKGAKVQEMDGSEQPFVPAGISDDTLDQVAKLNGKLNTASQEVSERQSAAPMQGRRLARTRTHSGPCFAEAHLQGSAFLCDIGDLFRYLFDIGKEIVIDIVQDKREVWHFVANIRGKLFAAELDTLEAIGSAVVWVYNTTIKMAVEWVIKFLEFLFGWQDILVTHRVIKKFILLSVEGFTKSIPEAKAALTQACDGFRKNIEQFTGLNVEGLDQTPAGALKSKGMDRKAGAPGNTGVHHYKGGARQASSPALVPGVPDLDALGDLAKKELNTLSRAADEMKTKVIDHFTSLPLATIVERTIGIVGEALVDSVENMALEYFDLVASHVDKAFGILDKPLHIPVLSWLYKMLTGDTLSVLDLLCLIAAIPATIEGKLALGRAPFPKGSPMTERMLHAETIRDWNNAPFAETWCLASAPPDSQVEMRAKSEEGLHKAMQALALGFAASVGTVIDMITTVCLTELKKEPEPNKKLLTAMQALNWVAYMAMSTPSINRHIFDTMGDTSKWYINMGNVLMVVGKVQGFGRIFFAGTESKTFPLIDSTFTTLRCFVGLIPTICQPILDKMTQPHEIVGLAGSIAWLFSGCISLDWYLAEDPLVVASFFHVWGALDAFYGVTAVASPLVWLYEESVAGDARRRAVVPSVRRGGS